MSEIKRVKPARRSSNSSISSRASNVSFSEKVRRESTAKFDNFMKECRAAYLAVLSSTTEKITSIDELILALQFGGRNPSRKFAEKYWKHNTDSISYNDFCDIMRKEKPLDKDSMLKAFKCIDTNGDGFITHDELFRLLTKQGERMTKSEVQAILDDADVNNDGKLDYNEFAALLVSTAEDCKQKSLKKLARADDDVASSPAPYSAKRQSTNRKTLQEPENLKDWNKGSSKGSFFIDRYGMISSHHYKLHLTKDSEVFVTIQSTKNKKDQLRTIDMAVFCVDKNSELVAFTASKLGPKFCFRCELEGGTYSLITFTTGCRLSIRKAEPAKQVKLTTGHGENLQLSKIFEEALSEIFDGCDLDGNGSLSREEFDLFQFKSGGDLCDDDAWEIMKDNFEMEDDEITLKGFLDLNMMEAQDADGDPNDLWLTLENMGYNKALELDQANPFLLEVYCNRCRPSIQVNSVVENKNEAVHKAVVSSVLNNVTKKENIKGMRDLVLFKYESSIRVTLVLQNMSHSDVVVRVDCRSSKNCLSHRGDLDYTIQLDANSTEVVHHFVPQDVRREMFVKYSLTIEQ